GWNEGALRWRVIPRNSQSLGQSGRGTRASGGLFNGDCSVMPVKIFTEDHKAETIEHIISEVKVYQTKHGKEKVQFKLATGNVGIMAATNEEVSAAQFPILFYVFAAIIVLCYFTYRSVRAVLCIVLPLALVSLLGYAVMAIFEIGLKISTLPVIALGVGVGVDYSIYIFSRFKSLLDEGMLIGEAYRRTLEITGNGVVFTGVTMAIGVATWMFSPLKFQADMGFLLTFMFLVNMLASIFLLPALACFLLTPHKSSTLSCSEKISVDQTKKV
ncbi:MAG: MMPL family transporter, partial [Desulfuromusa sp.]|nr:MMPL family transporter [Desulfuromusa sp.]